MLAFTFPGQGSQQAGMGHSLQAHDPVFRAALQECFAALGGADTAHLHGLRELMFGDDPAALTPTAITQPALFAIEYATAQVWLSRGLQPAARMAPRRTSAAGRGRDRSGVITVL